MGDTLYITADINLAKNAAELPTDDLTERFLNDYRLVSGKHRCNLFLDPDLEYHKSDGTYWLELNLGFKNWKIADELFGLINPYAIADRGYDVPVGHWHNDNRYGFIFTRENKITLEYQDSNGLWKELDLNSN